MPLLKMARHNNVKIQHILPKKLHVLFATIPVNVRLYY